MAMKLIEKIRKSTDEMIEDIKWPLRLKMIVRAAESFTDAIESEKITTEQTIIDLRKKLTLCKDEESARKLWAQVAKARLEALETAELAKIVQAEFNELMSDVKE